MVTPGPWFYDPRTDCIGTPAGWLAKMSERDPKSDIPFGSKKDDIRLIAAAPDLLYALTRLCNVNELHDKVTPDEFIKAYNDARSLIQKITGK